MIFTPTRIPDVMLIDLEPIEDERGFFSRCWCREEFRDRGLNDRLEQCNLTFNRQRGTVRGLHYQVEPWAEAKVIRAVRGAIWDVAVDLRPDAPTFTEWVGVELSAENRRMIYIPEGFAHGFITLTDTSEVLYQMSAAYHPESARGVRWNDPAFGIDWPIPMAALSPRDAAWPAFERQPS